MKKKRVKFDPLQRKKGLNFTLHTRKKGSNLTQIYQVNKEYTKKTKTKKQLTKKSVRLFEMEVCEIMERTMYYIPVANSFFDEDKLTPRELYLYSYLHTRRNYYTNTTITNINIIENEVKFVKKRQSNRNIIVEALQTLKDKEIIYCDSNDWVKDKCLNISFRDHQGYEKVDYNIFELTSDPEEFMVLCYILKRKGAISFLEFANVLGCSEKHVQKLINTMEDKALIVKNSGKYYLNEDKQPRQEKNSYEVVTDNSPDVLEDDTEQYDNDEMKNDNEQEQVFETAFGEYTLSELKEIIAESNWGKKEGNKYAPIEYEDYLVYKMAKEFNIDPAFVGRCEKIMDSFREKSFYDGRFEQYEKEYRREIKTYEKTRLIKRIEKMEGTPVFLTDGDLVELNQDNIDLVDFSEIESVAFVRIDKIVGKYGYSDYSRDIEKIPLDDFIRDENDKEQFIEIIKQRKFTRKDLEQFKKKVNHQNKVIPFPQQTDNDKNERADISTLFD